MYYLTLIKRKIVESDGIGVKLNGWHAGLPAANSNSLKRRRLSVMYVIDKHRHMHAFSNIYNGIALY